MNKQGSTKSITTPIKIVIKNTSLKFSRSIKFQGAIAIGFQLEACRAAIYLPSVNGVNYRINDEILAAKISNEMCTLIGSE